ncbi:nitroreductase family deazaflavin-dependent oxidoreductase [Nocardia sp. NPDC101769]|uniref:nitroreductase family deazaflavin-dependent oxidoreductase n=1 Tax=Nocardia sp. NPDC101769 TaxID=3364333 RepID=UPI00380B247E
MKVFPRPELDRDAIRRFNKRVLNPVMLRLAGRRHWYAAVIRHTGRRSGKAYATPIVAEPVADGFIIPLPYGTQVDWLRNVLARGRATLQRQGVIYDVADPRVIDSATAAPQLPAAHRRTYRSVGVDNYLHVRTGGEMAGGSGSAHRR